MKLPEIKGFVDVSLSDWDGKISAVIFLPHCNFRCPFCYNTALVLKPQDMQTIPYEQVEQYLTRKKDWIDGVAITGGEPTIHPELPSLCRRIKESGLRVKVDTNGTNASMVQELTEQKIVDCIALDIKASLNVGSYSKTVGVNAEILLAGVEATADILLQGSVDYEFRTTLVPTLHRKSDIEQICDRIKGCRKYVLQNFKGDVETLNPNFKGVKPFSQGEMEDFLRLAKKTVPNTFLR